MKKMMILAMMMVMIISANAARPLVALTFAPDYR